MTGVDIDSIRSKARCPRAAKARASSGDASRTQRHVGAGRERLVARARDHGGADALVGLDLAEAGDQVLEHVRRQRVEPLGPVEREQRDPVPGLEGDGHGRRRAPTWARMKSIIPCTGAPGVKTSATPELLERRDVVARDRAADDHQHVVGALVAQQLR